MAFFGARFRRDARQEISKTLTLNHSEKIESDGQHVIECSRMNRTSHDHQSRPPIGLRAQQPPFQRIIPLAPTNDDRGTFMSFSASTLFVLTNTTTKKMIMSTYYSRLLALALLLPKVAAEVLTLNDDNWGENVQGKSVFVFFDEPEVRDRLVETDQ